MANEVMTFQLPATAASMELSLFKGCERQESTAIRGIVGVKSSDLP